VSAVALSIWHAADEVLRKNRLKNRFIFMGILNAVFAPFIILYLLMYSFFRYFEVSRPCSCDFRPRFLMPPLAGVPQESISYWIPSIHTLRSLEISGIQ